MILRHLIFLGIFISCVIVSAQGKFHMNKVKSDRINFQLINNLIVFPVEVNGVELSFLLDTGVSKPIIFNFLNISEGLQINQAERINIRGLGEGEAIEALRSKKNIFKIGEAINVNQDLFAVFDPAFNFAPRLGVAIHGIIGYDFLKDFVVEINYAHKYIRLINPEYFKKRSCRKCEEFDLEFMNNKPYIKGHAKVAQTEVPVKLLIDSGGSDALWLFEDALNNLPLPDKHFEDFLGLGLSGRVFGKRTKINGFRLKSFELNKVNAAFPDSTSTSYARKHKDRNGSISGEVLKRFNVVFDYSNRTVQLKPNRYFREKFHYNKSGIVLEHDGVRAVKIARKTVTKSSFVNSNNESVAQFGLNLSGGYDFKLAQSFKIVELRHDSPALKAGLEIGDIILSINGKGAHNLSLQELTQIFYGTEGKTIKLLVDRRGVQLKYKFKLEELL